MKNKEALNLFKIYLSQSYMRKPNQVNYHDNGHDNCTFVNDVKQNILEKLYVCK